MVPPSSIRMKEPDNRKFRGVGDVVFLNTSLSYDINDRFGVRLIIDNILDQDPPFPAPVAEAE